MFRKLIESILGVTAKIQYSLMKVDPAEDIPVVFIIGAPRSGTTLLYQVLVSRYRFGYFTNFSAPFYAAPSIGLRIGQWISWISPTPYTFESSFGRTNGWLGPHEGASFWYRWFPRGDQVYVGPGQMNSHDLKEIRVEIASMYRAAAKPLLFKNTFNSMRIAPLAEALPEASFIVCRRDPIDTAQSILNARINVTGNKSTWWSLPPREVDAIKQKPYWDQVVEQVFYTERQIDMDRKRYGSDRFLDVSYRNLCRNAETEIEIIGSFLKRRGIDLTISGNIPAGFHYSGGKQVDEEDYIRIQSRVNQLWI